MAGGPSADLGAKGASRMKVSVVGLGKLGSPMAAVYAAKGHRVVGADLSRRAVDCVNRAEPPVYEPGLADWLKRASGRLSATTDAAAAVAQTDATFLLVQP